MWVPIYNSYCYFSDEMQYKVKRYPASEELVLSSGLIHQGDFHEVKNKDSLDCSSYGNETTKWKLSEGKMLYTIYLCFGIL